MKYSVKGPRASGDLTPALLAKYLPLLNQSPHRIALWMPLHRTPSPNRIQGRHYLLIARYKTEAREALLSAQVSKLPSSGWPY